MPEDAGKVVTRFAPSPTGYLHIGGARTALFNWAFARKHGGRFILRIEDTDKARSTPEATRRIISDLKWLGIDWDEGPDADAADPYDLASQRGGAKPYFQSQRGHLYKDYLQRLIDLGRAYPDAGAFRFRMPESDITVHDLVLGDVTIKRENLEDFVIVKSDGGPTFHFANVVDDATMSVTHVLRAQEHLMNTPKHVAMFDALGIARPKYAHMPLIFNADGSKMSKRDKAKAARQAAKAHELPIPRGVDPKLFNDFLEKKSDDANVATAIAQALGLALPEIDVHDFRVSGYLPGVILNYVALLGWSPENKDAVGERFDLDFLAKSFALEGIGKSNAKFDREKLRAFNGETLQKLSPEEFREKLRAHLAEFRPEFLAKIERHFDLFAESYRPRARTLDEPAVLGGFFALADDAVAFDAKAVEKVIRKNDGAGAAALRELRADLAPLDDWSAASLHARIEDFAKRTGRGMGDVAQPLRVAVSGSTVSPAIHDTLAILGKQSTLKRIDACLQELERAPLARP